MNDLVSSSPRFYLAWLPSVLAPVLMLVASLVMIIVGSWESGRLPGGELLFILPFCLVFFLWFFYGAKFFRQFNRWVWFNPATGEFQVGKAGQQQPLPLAAPAMLKWRGSMAYVKLVSTTGAEVVFVPTFGFYREMKSGRYRAAGIRANPSVMSGLS